MSDPIELTPEDKETLRKAEIVQGAFELPIWKLLLEEAEKVSDLHQIMSGNPDNNGVWQAGFAAGTKDLPKHLLRLLSRRSKILDDIREASETNKPSEDQPKLKSSEPQVI